MEMKAEAVLLTKPKKTKILLTTGNIEHVKSVAFSATRNGFSHTVGNKSEVFPAHMIERVNIEPIGEEDKDGE